MASHARFLMLAVVTLTGGAHAQPELKDIGAASWGEDVLGWRMNADGTVVVGHAGDPGAWCAFRWTADNDEIEDLGVLPGHDESKARGVSDDGNVVVGQCQGDQISSAFRWTPGLGMQELPAPPGWRASSANDVSGDGRVIVGLIGDGSTLIACRWVDDGIAEPLGVLPGHDRSTAYGVSDDGRFVAGWSISDSEAAFLWSQDEGMIALGLPPGAILSAGTAISADGSTVAGVVDFKAAWWRADIGWQYVFPGPGAPWSTSLSFAYGVTATGKAVVGEVSDFVNGYYAFYWREDIGGKLLEPPTLGIPYGSWHLTDATDISPDGTVILAQGYFANATRTCVITGLPRVDGLCLPDFTGDGVLDMFDVQAFLSHYASAETEADLHRDGVLDFFDLQAFLTALAAGCEPG